MGRLRTMSLVGLLEGRATQAEYVSSRMSSFERYVALEGGNLP